MKIKTLAKAIIIVCMSLLFSCGPVYKTSFSYTPPGDLSGNQCINNCQLSQQQCEFMINQDYQSCLNRSNINYNLCLSRKVVVYDSESKSTKCVANCSCYKEYCREPDFSICTSRYNTCYLNCGGTVVETTQCVSNCEEAEPPSTQIHRGARTN